MPKQAQKYYKVLLPCKPYIKKFFAKLYGGGELIADHGTAMGCYVNMALEKNVFESRHITDDVIGKNLTATLILKLNLWQWQRLGYDINKEKVIMINRYLEEAFQEALYLHCLINTEDRQWFQGYKLAILEFAKKFNILVDHNEEDITYDGLKKIEYRHRQKVKAKSLIEAPPVQGQLFF